MAKTTTKKARTLTPKQKRFLGHRGTPRVTTIPKRKHWDGTQWISDVGRAVSQAFESKELRSPYRQEPWIYACVRRINDAVETASIDWFEGEGDDAKLAPESHPLVNLWRNPNAHMSEPDMLGAIATHLSLAGESLLLLLNKKGGPVASKDPGSTGMIEMPHAIVPVMGGPRITEVVDDSGTRLVGWRIPHANTVLEFPAASVVMVRYPDPDRIFRGLGPLGAVFGVATQSYLAQRYQSNLLSNGGEPGGVVSVEGILSAENFERLQHEVETGWNDVDRAGEVRLLEGGAKFTPLGTNPKDMSYSDLLANNRKVMSAVYGVPDSVLGGDASNYATFAGHLRIFWTLTNLPILTKVVRTIRYQLVSRLSDDRSRELRPQVDVSHIQELQGDMKEAAATAQTFWSIGVPLNSALALAGVSADEFEGGDVGLVGSALKPLAKLAEEGAPDDEDRTADPTQALSGIQVKSMTDIVKACALGEIPKSTAIELIVAAFPIDRSRAEAIMKDVVEGSVKPPTKPGAAPAAEDEDPDEEASDDEDAKSAESATPRPESGAIRSGVRASAASQPATKAAASPLETRDARVSRWKQISAAVRPTEDWLDRKIRSVFHRMRVAQLARLKKLAEGGKVTDSVPVYAQVRSVGAESLKALVAAVERDAASGADVAHVARDCSSAAVDAIWTPGPALRAWVAARPRVKAVPAQALYDLALATKANLTPDEIDQMLAVMDKKWAEELAAILETAYERAVKAADSGVIAELGASFVASANPKTVAALATKPILVAEGVQSTVAQNLRTSLVKVLSESAHIGTIQDRILADFEELNKATRDQFNMNARRARTIARTETGQASSMIRAERMNEAKDQGIATNRRWVTAVPSSAAPPYEDGGFVRSQHWQMDGKLQAIGSAWSMPDGTSLSSVKSPGGPAHQVINCRCEELPEIDESALI